MTGGSSWCGGTSATRRWANDWPRRAAPPSTFSPRGSPGVARRAGRGPRQPVNQFVASLITSALTGQTVVIAGNGSATRDYLHVDDQVAGIARVLWKGEPGTVYNIGDGVQISGSQLAETILDACGKPSSLKRLTREGPGWSYAVDPRRMRPLG